MFYNITVGRTHKVTNEIQFYTPFDYTNFDLKIIKNILINDKIDIEKIVEYRYYDEEKGGYVKMDEFHEYKKKSDKLKVELHMKSDDQIYKNLNNLYYQAKSKCELLKKRIEKINSHRKNEEYDLIFLYASPINDSDGQEFYDTINYRLEIKKILKSMNKSKKQFKCIFECANEKNLRKYLNIPTKILYISCHGLFEKKDDNMYEYSLILEENGVVQKIKKNQLEEIIKKNSSIIENIDLIFISSCHSEHLGKIFLQNNAKNVIYIHGLTKVSNLASWKFTEYFFDNLINKNNTIKNSFDKAKDKVKIDRMIQFSKVNNCCCDHIHEKNCCHDEYHEKQCDCKYDEHNIHKKNCEFLKLLEKNKDEVGNKFTITSYKNYYVKVCCCGYKTSLKEYYENVINNNDNGDDAKLEINGEIFEEIPHNEYLKFILKQRDEDDDKIIFKDNKKVNSIINDNYGVPNFDEKKTFSVIGRRKEMKEISDIINNNSGNSSQFIIISGAKEIGKQNFVESLCVHLLERKIIQSSSNVIDIENENNINKIENEISYLKNNKNFKDNKYVIVIKISYSLDEQKSNELLRQLLKDIKNKNSEKNIFFLIIIALTNKPDKNYNNNNQIFHLGELKPKAAQHLLKDLCLSYGYEKLNIINYNKDKKKIMDYPAFVNYDHKMIFEIAEYICQGYDYENLQEKFKSILNFENYKREKIEESMKKKIFKLYYLLSIMKNGLPITIIKLFYSEIEDFIKEKDKSLIYQDNDNWYKINKNKQKEIAEYAKNKQEYIESCLKIYARLLYFYIKKNREKILYSKTKVLYVFNSYNGKGIWRTFDEEKYKQCFPYENIKEEESKDIKDYYNCIENDFDLDKIKDNIFYFIESNSITIQKLIKDESKALNREYIQQILLMLSSCYYLKKNCKCIIKKCLNLCCNKDLSSDFSQGKLRLKLFLYSLDEKEDFDLEDFKDNNQLYIEASFLYGLKHNDKKSFEIVINSSKDLYKKSYANYELSFLYFKEKNYKNAKKYLKEARKLSIENKNDFLEKRCTIDLALVYHKESQENEENEQKKKLETKCFNELRKVINEKIVINDKKVKNLQKKAFQNEAYNLKIQLNKDSEPDIIILSSNPLNNNLSVLNSGICAYHNNHYYLLEKIREKNLNVKIECKVLNQINITSFDKEGRILIIQSDDFSDNGEIVLETDYGESKILRKDQIKYSLPQKLEYDVVILCFINSSKIKDLFQDKVQYLITFEEIEYDKLDKETLIEYNHLSINFLINFIEKTTVNNIRNSFEEAHEIFINEIRNCKKLELKDYISLIEGEYNITEIIKYKNNYLDDEEEKKCFYYPFINLNQNGSQYINYSHFILDSIIKIKNFLENNKNLKGSTLNSPIKEEYNLVTLEAFKNRFLYLKIIERADINNNQYLYNNIDQIGIEILKFFHRHQTFKQIFCIFDDENIENIRKEIRNIKKEDYILIFTYINNNKILVDKDNKDPLKEFDNIIYLIMSEYKIIKNEINFNNASLQVKNNKRRFLLNDFDSLFTYNFEQYNNDDNLSYDSEKDD